jgi:hypothetical protein
MNNPGTQATLMAKLLAPRQGDPAKASTETTFFFPHSLGDPSLLDPSSLSI